ncbi:acyl-protein thioesterase 1-like [Amphiura filiformis]|uniref:acyl-protein thioesterase 1-like n=1 Tax=Amphiura filiformis TaxID=82378 RepID=UPI003B21A351
MCGNSVSSMETPVIVEPMGTHTATVFFLHGLGDTGHGWGQQMNEIKAPHIKYVCPTAKQIPVTLNGGMKMNSWFDIKSLSFDSAQDEAGITGASDDLKSWIAQEEQNGIPASRIVLAGFSQGGAVALYTALTLEKKVAGVIGLSTWLPLHHKFPDAIKGVKDYPFLQCHGDMDPMVNYAFGNMTSEKLKKFASNHEFKTYSGMQHSSCYEEMEDVKSFLNRVLPASPPSNH